MGCYCVAHNLNQMNAKLEQIKSKLYEEINSEKELTNPLIRAVAQAWVARALLEADKAMNCPPKL